MKLSIFTTVTDPAKRGDNWKDAFACYRELADEVIVMNGSKTEGFTESIAYSQFKYIDYEWPSEFSWDFIGQQFQRGYEAATGDWVIHADIDFIFHQKDFGAIRQALKDYPNAPAVSFYKWQFTMPDRYNLKSRLVIAVNKGRFGDRIKFDSGGDLCQPSLDGRELKPEDVPQAGIAFYNYEKLLKTERQIKNDVNRMARAWHEHFGDYHLGTDKTAYSEWLHMALGRLGKPHQYIKLEEHPKYVQETIKKLIPNQWGFYGFGNVHPNRYAEIKDA